MKERHLRKQANKRLLRCFSISGKVVDTSFLRRLGQHLVNIEVKNKKRGAQLLGIPLIFIKQIFKSFSSALVLRPEGMTVDVHGRAGLSMSKPPRDCLHVDVLGDQERRGCMPKPVEGYQGKLVRRILAFVVLPEDALKDRVRRRGIHLLAIPLNENEIVSGPFGSDRKSILLLF